MRYGYPSLAMGIFSEMIGNEILRNGVMTIPQGLGVSPIQLDHGTCLGYRQARMQTGFAKKR